MAEHRKLVRDRIPAIIQANGEIAIPRVLEDGEYTAALHTKLREESDELRVAPPQEKLEELADLLEVVRALAAHSGYSLGEVLTEADAKAASRGGFDARLWLEETSL